jgi:hypothetical protein
MLQLGVLASPIKAQSKYANMPVRPVLEEDTTDRVDTMLQSTMSVDPEVVGMDQKINVLLDELQKERNKNVRQGMQQQNDRRGGF